MSTFDDARDLALTLPEAHERTSYGRAAFAVGKTVFTCIGRTDDHIVIFMPVVEAEMLVEPSRPHSF